MFDQLINCQHFRETMSDPLCGSHIHPFVGVQVYATELDSARQTVKSQSIYRSCDLLNARMLGCAIIRSFIFRFH
jgi:hypothetical protein